MSPGTPWSHGMGMPPARWVPELSGAVNPAWAITYAVRPEQSKPISVPQELYWPPPRAQPLVGPEPLPPPPSACPTCGAANPAARPLATAGVGAVMVFPASAGVTSALLGTLTCGPFAETVTAVGFPPPVAPKYVWNRRK